ncbi:OmpA family protein [Inquilinus sp. KBS0705]|nr:OmpA family protein [Inquilinus sp. KBS0705]
MAQLDIQPKKNKPIWVWVVLMFIALGLLFFFLKGCSNSDTPMALKTMENDTASADTVQKDTISTNVATTQPDWDAVDFDLPRSTYDEITDTAIVVKGNQKYTIYGLGENVLFAKNESKLQGSANGRLQIIAASLLKRFKNASIGVYGHTDSTGTATENKTLGDERATAVKEWLVLNAGMPADKISVHSMGEIKPLATNGTEQGRQQNRSVEIVAFPQEK